VIRWYDPERYDPKRYDPKRYDPEIALKFASALTKARRSAMAGDRG
jgi:hypothetical protein